MDSYLAFLTRTHISKNTMIPTITRCPRTHTHRLALQYSHHTQMSSLRDDLWMMLDKCRTATDRHIPSKEVRLTTEGHLKGDHLHPDKEARLIAASPAKDHPLHVQTLCNIGEAVLRPCNKASSSRLAEVPMAHRYNSRGRILTREVCSVVIRIQTRFLNIPRPYVRATWEECLVNQQSRRLFVTIRMHQTMPIIGRCHLISRPSRLLDKTWIDCVLL